MTKLIDIALLAASASILAYGTIMGVANAFKTPEITGAENIGFQLMAISVGLSGFVYALRKFLTDRVDWWYWFAAVFLCSLELVIAIMLSRPVTF